MQSITRNLPVEYRGRLLRPAPLPDENELFLSLFDCLPRSTSSYERIHGDALAVLGVLILSRDSDGWTMPVARGEIARFFQHQWSAGRTDRLIAELLRGRFLDAREYAVRKGSGWRTWTRFRVRSRSERAADAPAIARRHRHR